MFCFAELYEKTTVNKVAFSFTVNMLLKYEPNRNLTTSCVYYHHKFDFPAATKFNNKHTDQLERLDK